MKTDNKTNATIDLPQYISKVKKQDKIFRTIYTPIIILYIIIIVGRIIGIIGSIYNNTPFTEWIIYVVKLLPFVIIYFALRKRYKWFKRVDYSQPTYLVLKSMERRYRGLSLEDPWIIIALFLFNISMGIDSPMSFLSFQLSFWAMMLFALLIGYIYWYIKIKPLRDRASQLIKELEE